ncbi:MAG: hypothetical protein K8R21_03345 [Leptospira sp.]|nr:hypothetical protein [Leptospira sp.]
MEEHSKILLLEDEVVYDGKDRDAILRGIGEGKKIALLTSYLSEKMEAKIAFVVSSVLRKYNKGYLQSSLYSMLKELAINATKANAKKIFFHENGIESDNSSRFVECIRKFKENLNEEWIRVYGEKAKAMMFFVCIVIEHDANGLIIKVKNTSEISQSDENRLREKLRKGLDYKNMSEYYIENMDQTEGEGIGLVLNLFLMRGENLDPGLFRIGNVNGCTVARMEIPFTNDFVSIREKYLARVESMKTE